ncbi:hypothetical protein [Aestuariivita boseongensis]|uniref:hypothetical protein n=1 Tax=Aestuariivita boseongensis TaxID=1470562 RepID=UPI000683135D|nr:hypothetical protein [Aestuariivita boseongensis]
MKSEKITKADAEGALSSRERDDNYNTVVCRLAPRWRVIVCRQGIQWILQKAKAESGHGLVWRGFSYFLTRDALIKACARIDGPVDPDAMAILHQLPERFRRSP